MKINYNSNAFVDYINLLEDIEKQLPRINKKDMDKTFSNYASEIKNSLLVEGVSSSKKDIKKSLNSGNRQITEKMVENQILAFKSMTNPPEFNISSIYDLYSKLVSGLDLKDNKLEDGHMFRQGNVTIVSNKNNSEFQGSDPANVLQDLNELIMYANNTDEHIVIKAIVAHYIYELIHPFYDFNGRTGRFIPMWLMNIENKDYNSLKYFSTIMGYYREQYIGAFSSTIIPANKSDDRKFDTERFIKKIIKLLCLNQYQYQFIFNINKEVENNYKKSLTTLQKDVLMKLIVQYEIQAHANTFIKSKILIDEDEKYNKSTTSLSLKELVETFDILERTNTKPQKYKLKTSYTLFQESKIYKKHIK